jgi:hypothetical protein
MPKYQRKYKFLLATSLALILSGCARYKPHSYLPPRILKDQYLSVVKSPSLLDTYNKMPTGTEDEKQAKVAKRNEILTDIIALIDQNYLVFEDRYYGSDALVNFGGDVATLGLTGVSSVTGTAHLKSVLSAIATGTTGIKTSYQKNFFDQQTRSAIVQKMRAGRADQLALIQDVDHMKAPVVCPSGGCPTVGTGSSAHVVAPYSLESGLSDVEQYYEAGSIIGALQSIATSAGQTQKDAATKQKTNSSTQQIF